MPNTGSALRKQTNRAFPSGKTLYIYDGRYQAKFFLQSTQSRTLSTISPSTMSAAVAATICDGEVAIAGAETVAKAYPRFGEDYEVLGGNTRESFEETAGSRDF